MMRLIQSFVLLWLQFGAHAQPAQTSIQELVLDKQPFTAQAIRRSVSEFLARDSTKPVSVLRIFASKSDFDAYHHLKWIVEPSSYTAWLRTYRALSAAPRQISEVMRVGKISVLRTRNSDGSVSVGAPDGSRTPGIVVASSAARASIIHIGIDRDDHFRVFAVLPGLISKKHAIDLYLEIRRIFQDDNVTAFFRTDEWFIEQSSFPVFFPFWTTLPPSREVYAQTPTVVCWSRGTAVDCSGARGESSQVPGINRIP